MRGGSSRGRRRGLGDGVVVADVAEAGEGRAESDAGARGALDGLLELEEDEMVEGWREEREGRRCQKQQDTEIKTKMTDKKEEQTDEKN